jgi:hypothetical protein
MVRNVLSERTRRRIGLLSIVVAFALPACGAASAGTRDGSDAPPPRPSARHSLRLTP